MPITIPRQEVVDDIKVMPKFNADISQFTKEGLSAQEIADWAMGQEGQVTLNLSQASPQERAILEQTKVLLGEQGADKLVLFDEARAVDAVTERITDDVVSKAVEGFREFIKRALGDSGNFITEWNTYVATRKDEGGFKTLHYWNNLGLADQKNPLRGKVMGMFESLRSELTAEIEEKVLPHLDVNQNITKVRDQIDTLLLGMLSNMVRGIFYNYANAKKVYGMRKLAVKVLSESRQLRAA